ncbi:hypothetical protein MMC25_005052 [Agyrium rufum]|nr:hypothetical protein [Agyrium rufum]
MTFKELLRRKSDHKADSTNEPSSSRSQPARPPPLPPLQTSISPSSPPTPEVTIFRSDTNTRELITVPSFPDYPPVPQIPEQHDSSILSPLSPTSPRTPTTPNSSEKSKRPSRLRSFSALSISKGSHRKQRSLSGERGGSPEAKKDKEKHQQGDGEGGANGEKRRSGLAKLRSVSYSSSRHSTSVHVPSDLPSIENGNAGQTSEDKEAKWEERATILAREKIHPGKDDQSHPVSEKGNGIENHRGLDKELENTGLGLTRPAVTRKISDAKGDDDIQEAIRLHEAGDLERSTGMFGRLADPNGENNALSQVLYGLALRHGWGIEPSLTNAITYLSLAASNSASVESQALAAGMKKGGAAKGELVLAIYELGNCFRHGWGVGKDPVAARNYYETAANLGDTDAMNEVARCYEEGFGGKKDRVNLSPLFFPFVFADSRLHVPMR